MLIALSCGGTPPDLRSCPRGDGPWRAALDAAGDDAAALSRIESLTATLASEHPERWEPRWARGEALFRAQRFAEAVPPYEDALAAAERERDPTGLACAANRLGFLSYYRGDLAGAESRLHVAIDAAHRAGRADLGAFAQNNLAGVLKAKGDMAGAVVALRAAATVLERLGMPERARDAAYNEGVLLLDLGDLAGAQERLTRVQDDATRAGDAETAALVAVTFGNLARARGAPAEAKTWFERAGTATPQVAVSSALGLGRVALEIGDFATAARELDLAARRAREQQIVIDALLADVYRGQVDLAAGRLDEAERRLAAAVAEGRRSQLEQDVVWVGEWLLGRVAERRGRPEDAEERYRSAVAVLERQDVRLDPLGEGMHFLVERSDPYTDWALLLARRGDRSVAPRLLEVIEKAHARALRRVAAARREAPALAELRRRLGPDELLLDFLFGRDAGVIVAVSSDGVEIALTGGTTRLTPAVAAYRAALQRPMTSLPARADPRADLARDRAIGQELRRLLLTPVARALSRARRVYVVADRDLALLPLAALPAGDAGDTFLGETHEIALLPMAGAGLAPAAAEPVLLAGDPLPDDAGRVSPLPRARAELDVLERTWGGTAIERLTGASFSPAAVERALAGRAGTIHFATHAEASSLDPRRCHVVLSRGERLGFDRIAQLPLGPSLVVLSACRTGEGEVVPGEGVIGLGWAFLAAGARGVVVSEWNVADADAEALMTAFHRRLRAGDDPVRALAAAQAERRATHWHPAFWAPFVVILAGR